MSKRPTTPGIKPSPFTEEHTNDKIQLQGEYIGITKKIQSQREDIGITKKI